MATPADRRLALGAVILATEVLIEAVEHAGAVAVLEGDPLAEADAAVAALRCRAMLARAQQSLPGLADLFPAPPRPPTPPGVLSRAVALIRRVL